MTTQKIKVGYIDPITASANQIIIFDGTNVLWANNPGGGSSANAQEYFASNTFPSNPKEGDEWLEANTGILYTYVTSNSANQWVELGPYNVVAPEPRFNLDGGAPDTNFGGLTVIDAGGVS
jgi:hypothetical protein